MVEIMGINKVGYTIRFDKGTPRWKELSDIFINDYLESGCTLNEYNEILNEDGEVVVRYCENDDEKLFEMVAPKEKIW